MKMGYKLSLLAVAALMASCNEKVSPELQEGSTETGTTVAVPPSNYYFRVVDQSATLLNYRIHKTGDGNANAKCQVTNTTGLSSEIFATPDYSNDITCFMEAEELSLHHGGFSFGIEASQNTCDYVGYQPFGFYNYQPGNSSGTYTQVTCAEKYQDSDITDAAAQNATIIASIDSATGQLKCNEFVSEDMLDTAPTDGDADPLDGLDYNERKTFTVSSDEELCRFNYSSSDGPNCDTGTIYVNELQVTFTEDDPATVGTNERKGAGVVVQRKIECGGEVYNCVSGPTKEIREDVTKATEITQAELNKSFTKTYTYAAPAEMSHWSNLYYVNFRRDLASKHINFVSTDTDHNSTYRSRFANVKTFDPEVMDHYSNNVNHRGTALIDGDALNTRAIVSKKWSAKPLAAEPYLGLAGKVNPFYTFYCFDTAFDVKARIRLAIREWDRIYLSNTTQLEYLSDIFYTGASKLTARQDIPLEYEIPNSYDRFIKYNDFLDWDDIISMDRTEDSTTTAGAFDEDETIWRPTPVPVVDPLFPEYYYPDGWYNPSTFPGNLSHE